MRLEPPSFWYRKQGALARALAPLAQVYASVTGARAARIVPYHSKLPVICIGNFTVGGGGKTPTAIAVAKLLQGLGEMPCFLTRGYGGGTRDPYLVTEQDGADAVGDEPLLLASVAPTVVAADRAEGARFIEDLEASVIVMDDGFQNPQLMKDLSLIVVDAGQGVGNGLVMPAGPLRAPLEAQMKRADALIVIGEGDRAVSLAEAFAKAGKPVLQGRIAPQGDPRWLGVLPVIGFAGIARPEKFFATLQASGARLEARRAFPDHHRYTVKEAASLLKAAQMQKCMLVTTEKDWVRLPEDRGTALGELKFRSRPLPIAIAIEDEAALKALLATAKTSKRTN
jgi:tetraacyldisaccharide 4'-kinase